MEGVGLAPLVEKGETVGETHGEAVLGEAGSLQVLTTHTFGIRFLTSLIILVLVPPS